MQKSSGLAHGCCVKIQSGDCGFSSYGWQHYRRKILSFLCQGRRNACHKKEFHSM
jgi:hypothetical protein